MQGMRIMLLVLISLKRTRNYTTRTKKRKICRLNVVDQTRQWQLESHPCKQMHQLVLGSGGRHQMLGLQAHERGISKYEDPEWKIEGSPVNLCSGLDQFLTACSSSSCFGIKAVSTLPFLKSSMSRISLWYSMVVGTPVEQRQ